MSQNFFESQTASSLVKAKIVSEYFPKYCRILGKTHAGKFRYIDLFSGPGKYQNGNLSTPLLVGKAISRDLNLKDRVEFLFNDKNKDFANSLRDNFESEFPKGTFGCSQFFRDQAVGENPGIDKYLIDIGSSKGEKVPTLLFFDPFGYKGMKTETLAKFMRGFGNELFLFLNTKRVNPALDNEKFSELMETIFPKNFQKLKEEKRYGANPRERLIFILENLKVEFEAILGRKVYMTPFRFQEEDSTATSHFILHFTKHHRGLDLIKQIYHEFDNVEAVLDKNGTYTFDAKKINKGDSCLTLELGDSNVTNLADILCKSFKGARLSSKKLYEDHHPIAGSGAYSRTHYQEALRLLVREEKVIATFTDNVHHKVSVLLSDFCNLEFK